MNNIVGIDLGTTNTCAAVVTSQGLEFLDLEPSSLTIPSAVRFIDGKLDNVAIGKIAKRYSILKPNEVFTSFKTLMQGEEWKSDPEIVEKFKIEGSNITPTHLASLILKHVHDKALEKGIYDPDEKIHRVLICTPAASTPYYKKEVINAALEAGFGKRNNDDNVEGIDIISEPEAAAFAYGKKLNFFDGDSTKEQDILVYDFGGGTFDVSILNVKSEKGKNPSFTLVNTKGATNLGGDDIDKALMKIVAKMFYKETGINLLDDKADNKGNTKKAIRQAQTTLKELAEKAKIEDFAAGLPEAQFQQLGIIEDCETGESCNLDVVVTYDKFYEAIKPLLDKTVEVLKDTLKDSGKESGDINRYVLVGGSSKAPWVKETVLKVSEKNPYNADNLDVIIAEGASWYAKDVIYPTLVDITVPPKEGDKKGDDQSEKEPSKPTIRSLTTSTIGVESKGGHFIPLVLKGMPLTDETPAYEGTFKCTNPNDSGVVIVSGWSTQEEVVEKDENGEPITDDNGNYVSNYTVYSRNEKGEKIFTPLSQFVLKVPNAEAQTLDIKLKLRVNKDNSITLEVQEGKNEPQKQSW